MNNALEILMLLVFFAPMGAMIVLNLAMYPEALTALPKLAPRMAAGPSRASEAPASGDYEFDFREAA